MLHLQQLGSDPDCDGIVVLAGGSGAAGSFPLVVPVFGLEPEPVAGEHFLQLLAPGPGSLLYLRMHGRNAAQWWDHDASEDRYNYLYTAGELEPFAARVEEARRIAKKVYLFMNNHFEAKAVANAAMITDRLGLDVRGTYTEAFLDRYPDLRGRVTPAARQSLF